MRLLKKTLKLLILLTVVVLISLPYATKFAVVYYLETEQKLETNIDDISINLLTGKISLEGVHLYGQRSDDKNREEIGELHLGQFLIDVSMSELFKKNILIESILFTDFSTNMTELDDAWNIGGVNIPLNNEQTEASEPESAPDKSSSPSWGYGVQSINFSNIKVDTSSQYTDGSFVLHQLKVSDLMSWQPSKTSEVLLDLSINGKRFNLSGSTTPFMDEPSIQAKIQINHIQIKPFLKSIKDIPFDEANVALFSDFDIEISQKENRLEVKTEGNYGLSNIYLKNKTHEIKTNQLMWNGKQNIILPTQNDTNISIDTNGTVSVNQIDVTDTKNNLKISQENVTLTGKYQIKLDGSENLPDVTATAKLELSKLAATTLDEKIKIASFDSWKVNQINVNGINKIDIQQSELNNIILLNDNTKLPALANIKQFIVNDIQYKPNSVKISKIEFRGLNVDARLNKQGEIPTLAALSPHEDKKATDQIEDNSENSKQEETIKQTNNNSTEKNSEQEFAIIIDEILLNSDSNIHFVDNSVTPIFDTKLHDIKLAVTDINSQDRKQPVNIDLDIKIDDYGHLTIKGNTQPFSEKVNATIIANLDSMELVPLSSYAGKFAGINIKRGTLSVNADIKVKQDTLDVNNTFYLNKLIIESDESEVKNNIFKDMPMPLDLTLNVLRDKQNVIKLDIPIKGNINNPDFSLQDIYNTAMVKAMKFAATQYLMQAVQPLGLVITAGKLIGKAVAPKFEPLIFKNGSSAISNTNKKHIKKLANILQDKDKLRFTICGTATESDWKAIQTKQKTPDTQEKTVQEKSMQIEKKNSAKKINNRTQSLLKLANTRTKQVKKHFVEVYKIDPKRLFTCNGKITTDEKDKPATPAVEITL